MESSPTTNDLAGEIALKVIRYFDVFNDRHVALLVGSDTDSVSAIRRSLSAAAKANDFAYAEANLTAADTDADVFESLSAGVLCSIGDRSAHASSERHPALQFRRVFDAVVDALEHPLILLINDVDSVIARANGDDILAAIRAALIPRVGQVHAVFMVRNEWTRRAAFNNSRRPLYGFVDFFDSVE